MPWVPDARAAQTLGMESMTNLLRVAFRAKHKTHPQYAGWEADAVAMVVKATVDGNGNSFSRADKGDVVLVKPREAAGWFPSQTPATRLAWCPRVGWNVSIPASYLEEAA